MARVLTRMIATGDGPRMVDDDTYQSTLQGRRASLLKAMTPYSSGTVKGARALENALGENGNGSDLSVGPNQIDNFGIPPIPKEENFATVAKELVSVENLLTMTRLPRNIRTLYMRAIVCGQKYGLPSMLDMVYTDLTLRIPEDGKARKELLIPIEAILRFLGRKTQDQGVGSPV